MRHSSFLVLSCLGSFACAFENIAIQGTVQAGTNTQGTISNDLSTGSDSFDGQFTHYRIYLATTPPGWGTGPSCTLANDSAIDMTTFTVNIPQDVGPDGSFYALSTIEYNSDPNKDGPSGFQYSDTITLEGAAGNWTRFELEGFSWIDADSVPCTAYGCAKSCVDQYYPDNKGDDVTAWIPTQECINACPGVVPVDISAYSSPSEPEPETHNGTMTGGTHNGTMTDSTLNGTTTHSTSSASGSASAATRSSVQSSATAGATGSAMPSGSGDQTGSDPGSAAPASSSGAASRLQMSFVGVIITGIACVSAFGSLKHIV